MQVSSDYIRVSDGHELFYVCYKPPSPIGHVHIIHGMAEHVGRYAEFAEYLANRGFIVSGHDQRGHGKTAERNGVQGYFGDRDGFGRIVEDAHAIIAEVQHATGNLPLILFGHSMGSFVTRRYMQLHSEEISRVVLSGTGGDPGTAGKLGLAVAIASAKTRGKQEPSKTLGKMTFGSFNKPFKEDGSPYAWLSRDKEAVAKYEADPLCGFESTNQFYIDLFSGLAVINKPAEIAKIREDLPVLLISGSMDPVGNNGKGVFSSANQFVDAGMANVKVYLVEQGRHELLNEIDRHSHFELIGDWMCGND
ncbi:alpha-beta hydrolase superfamily lysophospholipase [Planomicrobium stackebrandtii]|uniref:Alpha-beta hydrolase superfamily lysophospholipase n=1 Tax=Planomicrobium stackebrandtii TaxID=253160 RepID=A0ABU0GT14_9BACL|nr:alpha/beta hydrolase [Planomicrobium stackebrandtii]MDQ0427735.1 alpha-beta hydrolase superfamily lysophospholipase [Planomicrobium stackebrandtii]